MPNNSEHRQLLSGWGNYPKVNTLLKPLGFNDFTQQMIYRGLGRSYGDEAVLENGTTVTTTTHNRILSFDSKKGTVLVQSGISIKELIDTFIPKGFMPSVCPGTQYITVGGALANNIHGKGHHIDGSFVDSVRGSYSSVVGLPLSQTRSALEDWGVAINLRVPPSAD